MPFQPINFADIAPQGNPAMRDFIDNLASGYQAGQLPATMARKKQEEELKNAFQGMLNTEQPEKFRSEMQSAAATRALDSASTNRMNTLTPLEASKMHFENQGLERDNDPVKRIAYLHALMQGMNSLAGDNTGSSVNPNQADLNRAFIRKQLGLPQQTPEEQLQQQYKLYEMKKRFDKNADNLTTSNVTANQGVIQASNNITPMINRLKDFDVPGQFIGKYFNPSNQADYEAQEAAIADSLVTAFKLPKTNESIELVKKMVGKRAWENDVAYKNRLTKLVQEIQDRKGAARNALSGQGIGNDNGVNTTGARTLNLMTGKFE